MDRVLVVVRDVVDWSDAISDQAKYLGIVFVDASKGYTQADIARMVAALRADPTKLYLGYQADHSLGRRLFSLAFLFIHSRRIHDARSGLLAIPMNLLEVRDHPLNIVISAIRKQHVVEEVYLKSELQTSRSHSTWQDLWLLFQTFIKYVLSSFSSFLVDIMLFQLVIYLFGHLGSDGRILLATVVSRVFSSVVNYTLNKRVVFRNEGGHGVPALKYFSLVLAEMFTSAFFVAVVYRLTGFPETAIKLLVDLILFFTGYLVEKVFIFGNTKND